MDGIVYLRTPSAHPVSWANLFTDLCRLLPERDRRAVDAAVSGSARNPDRVDAGAAGGVPRPAGRWCCWTTSKTCSTRATGAVTDAALDEALRAVLSAPAHGVKVVITTRIAPAVAAAAPARRAAADRPGRRAALPVRRGAAAGAGPGRQARPQDRPGRAVGAGRGADPGVSAGVGGVGGDLVRRPQHHPARTARRRPAGCPTTWSRRWSGRRSCGWTRWPSR